jgi:hypothetical protein
MPRFGIHDVEGRPGVGFVLWRWFIGFTWGPPERKR